MAQANPTTSLSAFVVITLAYFILKFFSKSPVMTKVWTGIYVLLLIVSQYYINLNLTNDLCGFNQYSLAFSVTAIPWLLIFGLLNVMLMIFPGWLSPFSNTFGYLITKLGGVGKFFDTILKNKTDIGKGESNAKVAQALESIYHDKSLLINEISLPNLENFWSSMQSSGLIKRDAGPIGGDNYNKLRKFVQIKNMVGEFIWYILTGSLVTSVSYNYIVNTGCNQSVSQMKQRHKEYEKDVAKKQAEKANEPAQRVYSTTE